ncbi:MAG: hypothetical protein HWE24_10720 [Oceanospirillaceae bacterium]|nr:hypothetical protein [Oceanospirillaceae bacterium]
MYKINHKAVLLVFILQMIVGAIWYSSAPELLMGRSALVGVSTRPSVGMSLLFVLSTFVSLYFMAWLLAKVKGLSGFGRFFLIVQIWFFIVLPNYIFLIMHLNISETDSFYLLSYGAINCAIAACILPLWRSSRSIFKD